MALSAFKITGLPNFTSYDNAAAATIAAAAGHFFIPLEDITALSRDFFRGLKLFSDDPFK